MTLSPRAHWGIYAERIRAALAKDAVGPLLRRIGRKDAAVWKKNPKARQEIAARLGWLDAVPVMRRAAAEIDSFAAEVRRDGFTHALLLGMGGSSLAAQVFQAVYGRPGYSKLLFLESTDPESVRRVAGEIDLKKTLFIVSSKSGETIEALSFFKYFFERLRGAGEHFIAITDPGTPLERLAEEGGFRRIFRAPPDVGGRFSALTFFGLVPAALVGADIHRILDDAQGMMGRCLADGRLSEHPALALGVGMAVLAKEGRDKLTILAPGPLRAFADWAEQLVAESTGKEGMGVVPVVHETPSGPSAWGKDRFFVMLAPSSPRYFSRAERAGRFLQALRAAGHPVLVLGMRTLKDLGGEFFRWEMATAITGSLLGINPFDQPDVQASKDRTKALLEKKKKEGSSFQKSFFEADPDAEEKLDAFVKDMEPGGYIALLAFLPDEDRVKRRFGSLKAEIRKATGAAVTFGLGPRYLHSTGQLHKGGPNTGIFIFITAGISKDLPVPGEAFTFGELLAAQALGDLAALREMGRRVVHFHLEDSSDGALEDFSVKVRNIIHAGRLR